jgi:hypothetical protein
MKTFLRLLLIAITSSLLIASCSSDDDNNLINNNPSDAPMSCNITGAYNLNFEADMIYYSSVPDDEYMLRAFTGQMEHEGKSHVLIINLKDPDGNFKKDYVINENMDQASCILLYDKGDGLPPESYSLNISGNINFTTLTDSKAIGTFNCVAKTIDGSKQITITNGVINKN